MKKNPRRFPAPTTKNVTTHSPTDSDISSRSDLDRDQETGADIEPFDLNLLRRPPLTKRAAKFYVSIGPENFDRLLPSWLEATNSLGGFSEKTLRESWFFKVETEGNIPRPKAVLTQIARLKRNDGRPLVLEVAPSHPGQELASLTITQNRSDEHPTSFSDFKQEIELILPSFLSHFELPGVESLSVSYRNELSQSRYEEAWIDKNTVRLGSLLRVFRYMPNPKNAQFRDPFLIDFTRTFESMKDTTLRFRVSPESSRSPVAWVGTISYSCKKESLKKSGTEGILNEIASGHDFISDEFRTQFTTEALQLFSK